MYPVTFLQVRQTVAGQSFSNFIPCKNFLVLVKPQHDGVRSLNQFFRIFLSCPKCVLCYPLTFSRKLYRIEALVDGTGQLREFIVARYSNSNVRPLLGTANDLAQTDHWSQYVYLKQG